MSMQTDLGAVDTMIKLSPHKDMNARLPLQHRPEPKDKQSKEEFAVPGRVHVKGRGRKMGYRPGTPQSRPTPRGRWTGGQSNKGMIRRGLRRTARARRPIRPLPGPLPSPFAVGSDPPKNDAWTGINAMTRALRQWGIRSVVPFPAGTYPQVPSTTEDVPILTPSAWELGIPILLLCRRPLAPLLKFAVQKVDLIDEAMYDLPPTWVFRHPPTL